MNKNNHLMEQIVSPGNLMAAWRSIRSNIPKPQRDRSAGADGVSLSEYEANLTTELHFLSHSLVNSSYQPQPPKLIWIKKPHGGERQIGILTVADRVAQRAALQILEPLWEPNFLSCSFGFRPGLSVQDALLFAQQSRSKEHRWLLDGDITDFFSSINHDILVNQIQRKVSDRRVLDLIHKWLEVGTLSSGLPKREHSISGKLPIWVQQTTRSLFNNDLPYHERPDLPDPYSFAQYESESNGFSYRNNSYDQTLKSTALQSFAKSGLFLGANWAKEQALKAGRAALNIARSPAGQQVLKRSAATAAVVAVAATGAATAYLINQNRLPGGTGVQQGSPISPLFGNIYLHLFDLMMTRRGHALVRYADDWVVAAPNRKQAEKAYIDAERSLQRLKLELNPQKTYIHSPNEKVHWLGGMIS